MYDTIVVGARCAGSPTAMLLAQKGYRVLMVDRAGFPSDTLSTHYIHQPGVARLERWGLREKVAASNCPPVHSISVDFGPFALKGSPPAYDGIAEGYAPRRTVLDQILLEAAIAAGVEFRDHFSVTELVSDGTRIAGIRGRRAGAATVSESARIVIGADGLHSFVARAVQAEAYNTLPATSCTYYSYWTGVPLPDGVELYNPPNLAMAAGPTNDDATLIIIYWPIDDFHQIRADIEGSFFAALDNVPAFAERVRAGQRVEPYRGTADLRAFYRKPFGPGWALVGDAGYHKNPLTAQGITDAFRDAELLAGAIDAGFSGRAELDDALAGYERTRNEATMPLYQMTAEMAALQPPPVEQQQLIGALVGNQEQIDRFIGTIAGTTAIPDFFSPENVESIFARASTPAHAA
jgi:2-polyprenyl-6-methoxyphenol hydroxylase-like FAD-dependent oxidoreductase